MIEILTKSISLIFYHSLGSKFHLRCFHHHAHTGRIDGLGDCLCDLFGHSLLQLQSSAEHLHDTSQLAQSENLLVRQVSNGDLGNDRLIMAIDFCVQC